MVRGQDGPTPLQSPYFLFVYIFLFHLKFEDMREKLYFIYAHIITNLTL